MDTRAGFSTVDGEAAGGGPIGAGQTINLRVTGRADVPATGVGAVVLNVTTVDQTQSTFVTIWPAGAPRPYASNLNPTPSIIQPNLVIAKVGAAGEISIYNNSGSVDVVVDVQGWFPAPLGQAYTPLLPARILETRSGLSTIDGAANGVGALGPGETLDLQVTGRADVPSSNVSAVVVNVTAVNQTSPTFLAVFPSGTQRPNTSNLNPNPGVTAPNLVIAKVSSSGKVTIYNNSGTVDVIADIQGWFPIGPTYTPLDPSRLLDTRPGQLTVDGESQGGGPRGPSSTLTLKVTGRAGIPPTGVGAVVLNVTATDQTKNTFLTVFPTGTTRPDASNLNPTPGLVAPNLVIAKVGATGEVSIFNNTGSVNVIADVYGWMPSDIVAANDSATVAEDASATAIDVLGNDSDGFGGPLSIASSSQPAHGSVTLTGGTPGARTGLTYAPNANYCNNPPGTSLDTFTYMLNGGVEATVDVSVTCVDDPPVAVGDSAAVVEDDPATSIDVLVNDTDIDGGPKSIQSVTQPANGTVVITGGGTGLTYQPDPNYCNAPPGTATDIFQYTLNGGSVAAVNVTVTCVDDPPNAVADSATVSEDAAPAAIGVLANDIDVDGNMSIASASDPANGTVVITGGGTGLTYQPDPNYCNAPPGTSPDTFTYALNGGSSAIVSITVNCVDDAPTAVNDSANVAQDSGGNAIDVLANDTDIDSGLKSIQAVSQPANGTVVITGGGSGLTYQPVASYCNNPPGTPDTFTYALNGGSTATVSVTINCDAAPTAVADTATVNEDAAATAVDVLANDTDPDGGTKLISLVVPPANGTVVITGGGTGLTYQPNSNYCNNPPGTTPDTFTYTLSPGGSTAGVSVTVTCVDDPPTAVADSATVAEDSGATSVAVLVNDTDIDGGPKLIQSVTPAANGTVVITGGGTGLTYQPNADYCNAPPGSSLDTFTYTLNGGSNTTVSMTVTCVNDPPVADDETFNGASSAIGNTTLVVDDPTDGAPAVAANQPHKTIIGDILAGDSDVDGPGPLVVTAGTFATANGGSVTIESDGDFTFFPEAGASCSDPSDSFDYTISDQNPGTPGTDTGTVTVALAGCVWYVDNSSVSASSGTAASPFHTLVEAEAASLAGHTVFVFDGNNTSTGYDTGFALKSGQLLIGEAATLTIDVDGAGGAPPDTLHASNPAARPTITANNEDVIALDDGNDVRGLAIDPQGTGGGIAGGVGDIGGTIDDVIISDNGAPGARPGLELDGTSGTFNISNLDVNNGGSPTAIGVRLNNAGVVNFASAGTISISTNGAKALDVTNTNMSTSVFDSVTATNSGTGGISMIGATGSTSLGDGSGSDLAVTTTSGGTAAVLLSNSTNITVPAGGTADVNATGGPAIDIIGGSGSYTFDAVNSTNSVNDGINLDSLGTSIFTAASGNIAGATGIAVDINAGSGNITYAGNIGDGAGQTAEITNRTGGSITLAGNIADSPDAGGGIIVSGNSGGSTILSGSSKVINTATSNAVVMSTSDGHTLTFSGGGLDIDTTTGKGIDASTSGTLIITGGGNSISSGSGGALSVVNTDIGTGGINFVAVSSSGAPNGIMLSNTGGTAGLTITGSGTVGSGGVIANSSDNGVLALSTRDLNLAWMTIQNNGNALNEGGLRLINVAGAGQLTSSTVTGSFESNVYLSNGAGTLTMFTIHGPSCSITDNNSSQGNTGISVLATLSATMSVTVDNCLFHGNRTDSILADTADTSTLSTTITNNTFVAGSPNTGNIGVDITAAATSQHNFLVDNNKIGTDGASLQPLLNHGINVFAGNSSVVTGKVTNNIVRLAGSGASGTGIRVFVSDSGKINARVGGNTVNNVGLDYGIDATNNGNATLATTGALNLAVVNNNVSTLPAAINAVHVRGRRDTTTCAAITGNTATTNTGPDGISVSQGNTAIFDIEAPPPGSITDAELDTRLTGLNLATVGVDVLSTSGFTAVATNFCTSIPA